MSASSVSGTEARPESSTFTLPLLISVEGLREIVKLLALHSSPLQFTARTSFGSRRETETLEDAIAVEKLGNFPLRELWICRKGTIEGIYLESAPYGPVRVVLPRSAIKTREAIFQVLERFAAPYMSDALRSPMELVFRYAVLPAGVGLLANGAARYLANVPIPTPLAPPQGASAPVDGPRAHSPVPPSPLPTIGEPNVNPRGPIGGLSRATLIQIATGVVGGAALVGLLSVLDRLSEALRPLTIRALPMLAFAVPSNAHENDVAKRLRWAGLGVSTSIFLKCLF